MSHTFCMCLIFSEVFKESQYHNYKVDLDKRYTRGFPCPHTETNNKSLINSLSRIHTRESPPSTTFSIQNLTASSFSTELSLLSQLTSSKINPTGSSLTQLIKHLLFYSPHPIQIPQCTLQ